MRSSLQLSPEFFDLVAAIDQKKFKSPYHDGIIKIHGTQILQNDVVIDHINSDDKAQLLWAEFLHQESLSKAAGVGE